MLNVSDFSNLRIAATLTGDARVSWGSGAGTSSVTLAGVTPLELASDHFFF